MRGITTFLMFNDRAEEAMRFYVSVVPDSRILHLVHSEGDGPIPAGKVLLGVFELAGETYFACDGGASFSFAQGTSLYVHCETQAEIDHLWDALVEGGGRHEACGWLVDRFGLSWQIVPTNLDAYVLGDDRDRAGRAMDAMLKMGKLDMAELERAANG